MLQHPTQTRAARGEIRPLPARFRQVRLTSARRRNSCASENIKVRPTVELALCLLTPDQKKPNRGDHAPPKTARAPRTTCQ